MGCTAPIGIVVQLVRVPSCQDGSYGFEPRQSRSDKLINSSLNHMKKKKKRKNGVNSLCGRKNPYSSMHIYIDI